MVLNERLKDLRKQRGVTQKAIASGVGVTTNAVQQFEYGMVKPKLDTIIALADFFNVSVDYLVGRSDNPQRV